MSESEVSSEVYQLGFVVCCLSLGAVLSSRISNGIVFGRIFCGESSVEGLRWFGSFMAPCAQVTLKKARAKVPHALHLE